MSAMMLMSLQGSSRNSFPLLRSPSKGRCEVDSSKGRGSYCNPGKAPTVTLEEKNTIMADFGVLVLVVGAHISAGGVWRGSRASQSLASTRLYRWFNTTLFVWGVSRFEGPHAGFMQARAWSSSWDSHVLTSHRRGREARPAALQLGEGVEPNLLRYSYYTAGSGGAGPTILQTSFLLAGETVTVYKDGEKYELPPISNRREVDFGPGAVGNGLMGTCGCDYDCSFVQESKV
eukprot:1159650-Pelagomonas_calceolata.AAC.8